MSFGDGFRQRYAIHARHPEVRENGAGSMVREPLERGLSAFDGVHGISERPYHDRKAVADVHLIVDQEHRPWRGGFPAVDHGVRVLGLRRPIGVCARGGPGGLARQSLNLLHRLLCNGRRRPNLLEIAAKRRRMHFGDEVPVRKAHHCGECIVETMGQYADGRGKRDQVVVRI